MKHDVEWWEETGAPCRRKCDLHAERTWELGFNSLTLLLCYGRCSVSPYILTCPVGVGLNNNFSCFQAWAAKCSTLFMSYSRLWLRLSAVWCRAGNSSEILELLYRKQLPASTTIRSWSDCNVENVGYSCLNHTNTIIKSVTNHLRQTLIFIHWDTLQSTNWSWCWL